MATYKKSCAKCGELIPGDAAFCPFCENQDPFLLRCPKCRQPIEESWKSCSSCGIKLKTVCLACGKETPTALRCAHCGGQVMVQCKNKKCSEVQLLNREDKCIKCGKSLK